MLYSICIPTYNRPHIIKKAIDCALAQSYHNIEILIHDNSDNDETEKIVSSYKDNRIKYYHHLKNIGMYGNWNSLLNVAKGKYIKFLNDDDLLDTECIAYVDSMLKKIDKEQNIRPSLVTVRANYINTDNQVLKSDNRKNAGGLKNYYVRAENIDLLWCKDAVPIRTPTHSFYLNESVKKLSGFNDTYTYIADVVFGYEIAKENGNLILDEKPIVSFLTHDEQATNSMSIETRIEEQQRLKLRVLEQVDELKSQSKNYLDEIVVKEIALGIKDKNFKYIISGLKGIYKSININALQFFFNHHYMKRNFDKYYIQL